jgi:hypothetical protein
MAKNNKAKWVKIKDKDLMVNPIMAEQSRRIEGLNDKTWRDKAIKAGQLPTSFADKYEWKLTEDEKIVFDKIVKAYSRRMIKNPILKPTPEKKETTIILAGIIYCIIMPIPRFTYKIIDKKEKILKTGIMESPGFAGSPSFNDNPIDLRECVLAPKHANKAHPCIIPTLLSKDGDGMQFVPECKWLGMS